MIDSEVNRLPSEPDNPYEEARGTYLRLLALVLIVFGLRHWVYIVGVYPDSGWNLETMSADWRFATVVLGVGTLIAAVGLWMRVVWGLVVWAGVALFELAIHTAFAEYYGFSLFTVGFHVVTVAAYAFLAVMAHRRATQAMIS
ncbi:DUF6163 family protein [Prosthecomicrobium pneumaticum]|uniref:Putative membrane protein n=1 Tax=Prosthecomicrobium pneumaticum TaxID=81895 RepID=A0A7W9L3N8_9HYPH|nr:DUF6163 family protein [Prosthecomicrobium pneumaticum]MBB5754746.1 putative membrane protein [Prosthecomicrobium pneumaticum]